MLRSSKATIIPTVGNDSSTSNNGGSNIIGGPGRRRKSLEYAVYTIAVVSVFVFFWLVSSVKMVENIAQNDKQKGKSGQWHWSSGKKANMICDCVCSQRRRKRSEDTGGVDLLNNTELLEQATNAKEQLLEKLHNAYGEEYFESIFVDKENGGYRPFKPSNEVSMQRLKRKLKIKVLSMQMQLRTQDSDFRGCDCSHGRDQSIRNRQVLEELDTKDESIIYEGMLTSTKDENDNENKPKQQQYYYEKYTWATGGHSASASHGNLYNESYTAYMESDLKDVFGSIGIEFEGRNYAMGGTASATIVSMCWKEIFGEDVDFFSWDYGMTDGNAISNLFHYAYRGALSPRRPAFMLIHNNGRKSNHRLKALQELEEKGLPLFHMVDGLQRTMKENFPDSQGISDEAINALPDYVRNYKCGNGYEKGDPYCNKEKFSKWGCTPRHKQTSWHPGFKDHALVGHSLALFLMEALLDVLLELKEKFEYELKDETEYLEELIEEDVALYTNLTTGPLPDTYKQVVDLTQVNEQIQNRNMNETSVDQSLFMNGPSMCHTARLPAQSRYQGILTNTEMVGKPAPVGEETYYVGHDIKEAHKSASENNKLRLVYESTERETQCKGVAPVTVKPDYPDSFYVNSLDGWAKLKLPNKAEKEFYRYDPESHQGIIVFHIRKCDWGKCPKNFLTIEDYDVHWEMKINNQQIWKVISIGSGAIMAMGEDSFRFDPNEKGQYEIEIKVKTEKKYLEFADFVLW